MFEPCPMVAQCIIIHYSALDVCPFALRSLSLSFSYVSTYIHFFQSMLQNLIQRYTEV